MCTHPTTPLPACPKKTEVIVTGEVIIRVLMVVLVVVIGVIGMVKDWVVLIRVVVIGVVVIEMVVVIVAGYWVFYLYPTVCQEDGQGSS